MGTMMSGVVLLKGCLAGLIGWAIALLIGSAAGFNVTGVDGPLVSMIGPAGAGVGFFAAVVHELPVRGGRSLREIAAHSATVAAILGITIAGACGLRTTTLAHLGLNGTPPAMEFEIRIPPAIAATASQQEMQVELRTDQNQIIAHLEDQLLASDDGRAILKGSVPLEFRTRDRVMVLNLPGQAQRLFRLRLPESPSRSTEFGPWHLVDRVLAPDAARSIAPNDAFAIRYRVL